MPLVPNALAAKIYGDISSKISNDNTKEMMKVVCEAICEYVKANVTIMFTNTANPPTPPTGTGTVTGTFTGQPTGEDTAAGHGKNFGKQVQDGLASLTIMSPTGGVPGTTNFLTAGALIIPPGDGEKVQFWMKPANAICTAIKSYINPTPAGSWVMTSIM